MQSLKLFLSSCKQTFEQMAMSFGDNCTFVVGNEACDLDSAACSLVLAHLKQMTLPSEKIVPIFNIPRDELVLHNDVTFSLSEIGISGDDLIFESDLCVQNLLNLNYLRIILVDHNLPSGIWRELRHRVVEVVDHRPVAQPYPNSVKLQVEKVGSCSTLIAEKCLAQNHLYSDELQLLQGAILLDTACLSSSAGKATERDVSVMQQLRPYVPDINIQSRFETLLRAKSDISGFTTTDTLRKDLKVSRTNQQLQIAFCSVPCALEFWLARQDVASTLRSFSNENKYDAVITMFYSIENNVIQKELGVYSSNSALRQKITNCLITPSSTLDLKLDLLKDHQDVGLFYSQGDITASRKNILPHMIHCLNEDA